MNGIDHRPSVEDQIKMKKQYLETIAPLVKMKADILNIQPVRYIIGEGILERDINWLPGALETFQMIDEQIRLIQLNMGLKIQSL